MVFSFSPCTNLAVSGAAWFKSKGLAGLIEGLQLFEVAREFIEDNNLTGMCENPVSTLSTYYRKPDYKFDPCDYAGYLEDPSNDVYTKKTCLWTFGNFIMPPKKHVYPNLGSKMHNLVRDPNKRSLTPMGFAEAVFQANGEIKC